MRLQAAALAASVLALVLPTRAAQQQTDDTALLKAINFALTGRDDITYTFADRLNCVVRWIRPSAQAGVQAVQTFYLNEVDVSRIAFFKITETTQYDKEYLTRVELHGESTIEQNTFDPAVGTQPFELTQTRLDLHTAEYNRVLRAWRYIYAHGCASSKTSF
jgi:hypothetical protein